MARNLTEAQMSAVNCDEREILVSAAAGSGKTSVLTERIIRHVLGGTELDKLLVVTFTEAAAAEMRERILDKLLENEKTAYQAALVPMADISTIHAFCRRLVKENFQLVNVDPSFRVGDDAELVIIKNQVMERIFEDSYAAPDNEAFLDLADVYGGKTTDERLDTLVRSIHNFLESAPFPMEAAEKCVKAFDTDLSDIDNTVWADAVRGELELGLRGAVEGLNSALSICNLPQGPTKYAEKLHGELEMVNGLLNAVTLPFVDMYHAFKNVDWGRLPRIVAKDLTDPALKDMVKRIRDTGVKKSINDLTKGVFFAPPEKMSDDLISLRPRVKALIALTTKFAEAYADEKRLRNILDFSDLEHFAIKILYPNGPEDMTPFKQMEKYYEVLTDEFQDSNEIQDLILSAVANRRFMVGDVKQSIYRFRRANPMLFTRKLKTSTRIDLSQNFRSRPEVLDSVNFFFSQLMCETVGDIAYDGAAALNQGSKYPDLPDGSYPRTRVEIVNRAAIDETEDEEAEDVSSVIAETRMIAECIKDLLNNRQVSEGEAFRKCRPGDIAIITRSLSGIVGDVLGELKKYNINAVADMNEGFFSRQEVKTAIAFLRVIDNPRQDIDLLTVLKSPVYALSPDDMLFMSRSLVPLADDTFKPDLYDKLVSYAENADDTLGAENAARFLRDLETWRAAAVYMPISRLIGLVYDSTGLPALVSGASQGESVQANLRLLLEKAIEFEDTSLKGLFNFILYIEKLSESGKVSAAAEPVKASMDKVRIMTIHKSKGLEFPIVICAFLGRKFNTDDERKPVILHSEKGLGSYYVDSKQRTRANTIARHSILRAAKRENLSEELRCLYVAMTRAKELLILSGCVKDYEKSELKWSDFIPNTDNGSNKLRLLPLYYRSSVSNYIDWIMPCVLRNRDKFDMHIHQVSGENPQTADIIEFENPDDDRGLNILPPLKPHGKPLPSKLSISEIKRLYDITPDSTVTDSKKPSFEPPKFIRSEEGITPMRLGSILHKITEHIDYDVHTTSESARELLQNLAERNLLTTDEAEAVDINLILRLTNSALAERFRQSEKIYRETPFVLAVPAAQIYPDESDETVLVHGIIDCYFEENGKIILVDFKSDYIPSGKPLEEWAATHRIQLGIYRQALSEATGKEVGETLLYSYSHGVVKT